MPTLYSDGVGGFYAVTGGRRVTGPEALAACIPGLQSDGVGGVYYDVGGVRLRGNMALAAAIPGLYSDGDDGVYADVNGVRLTGPMAIVGKAVGSTGFVIEGDSISTNYQGVLGWPDQLKQITGLANTNRATPNDTASNMDSGFATDVAPYFSALNADTLLLLAGINDIGASVTAAQLQAYITSMAAKARAAGFKTFLGTLLYSANASGPQTAQIDLFNAWLRVNAASIATGLLDFNALPAFQNSGDTGIFYDGTHITSFGLGDMAEEVRQKTNSPAARARSATVLHTTPLAGTGNFLHGNRTFQTTAADATARTTAAIVGKKAFAVNFTALAGDYAAAGIGLPGGTGVIGGDGARNIVYLNTGYWYSNGGVVAGPLDSFVNGETLGIVVDEGAAKAWATTDGVNYYGSTGPLTLAQVAAGTSGVDISATKALGTMYGLVGSFQRSGIRGSFFQNYPWALPDGYGNL